jgi:thiamine monophosphate kinase
MIETFDAADMAVFAQFCGHSLARSHARSGDAAVISGYLGESDTFDKAIADFSAAYADQTERDHAALKKAARRGKLEVLIERA